MEECIHARLRPIFPTDGVCTRCGIKMEKTNEVKHRFPVWYHPTLEEIAQKKEETDQESRDHMPGSLRGLIQNGLTIAKGGEEWLQPGTTTTFKHGVIGVDDARRAFQRLQEILQEIGERLDDPPGWEEPADGMGV